MKPTKDTVYLAISLSTKTVVLLQTAAEKQGVPFKVFVRNMVKEYAYLAGDQGVVFEKPADTLAPHEKFALEQTAKNFESRGNMIRKYLGGAPESENQTVTN